LQKFSADFQPNVKRGTRPYIRTLLLWLLLAAGAGEASAQVDLLKNLFGDKEQVPDSLREEKERKPLESYFFDDSLRSRTIFSWRVVPGRNQIDTIPLDTMPNRFEVDYPYMVADAGAAYLGNLGGAARPLNWFRQPRMHDFSFLSAYDAYLTTPERARFFNTKRPFTNLTWDMSGQTRNAEEQLRVLHVQNISPSTGIALDYLNRGTRGMYQHQRGKDKNLSLVVAHTGKRYSVHGGYIYNMGELSENGGIRDMGDVRDTVLNPVSSINVNLSDARNDFKWNSFFVTQAYGIPLQRVTDADLSIADKSSIFIGHAFEYTAVHKQYTDTRAESRYELRDEAGDPTGEYFDFYENWYIDPSRTRDSISETKMDNKLFIQIQPWNREGIVGTLDGGIGFTTRKYHMFHPDDYLFVNRPVSRTDTYLYGNVQGKLRRYLDWGAGVDYHFAGYRAQDIRLEARLQMSAYIRRRPVTLTLHGFIDDRTPDFWTENYRSNHFVWQNDFSKETETRLEARLDIPSIGLEAGLYNSLTGDPIYYGPDALPVQHNGTVNVTGIYVQKNFRAGIFRFNHRALYQTSTDAAVAPVPEVSAYASWFVDFEAVHDVLRMQVGVDGWYNTEYHAPAYNPATMQFYNQQQMKLGNYPFLDAFVSAKWKRLRVLVKFQHVNENLVGTRTYFQVPNYPLNRRMFKLGFSWSYYD
jgi:hypothetical protein